MRPLSSRSLLSAQLHETFARGNRAGRLPEGAKIFDAPNPSEAWEHNEQNFGNNPVPAAGMGSAASRAKIRANTELFTRLGFTGTPMVVYKDAAGKIHVGIGVPQADAIKTTFDG